MNGETLIIIFAFVYSLFLLSPAILAGAIKLWLHYQNNRKYGGSQVKKHTRKGWCHALCYTCGWELENINAQGVGARHAKVHKHRVLVTIELTSVYDGQEESIKGE